jgi:Arc/MetJ-type ribon-helix-helix transcriptional regulator
MTIRLPDDLQRYIQSQVECGRFDSETAAITEAVRLLQESSLAEAPPSMPLSEEEFERRLVQAGLLAPVPSGKPAPRATFQPIVIKGEPLSETVIRERR